MCCSKFVVPGSIKGGSAVVELVVVRLVVVVGFLEVVVIGVVVWGHHVCRVLCVVELGFQPGQVVEVC